MKTLYLVTDESKDFGALTESVVDAVSFLKGEIIEVNGEEELDLQPDDEIYREIEEKQYWMDDNTGWSIAAVLLIEEEK